MARLSVLLALLLALTGFGQAMAQGRMAGANAVTLCSEDGAVVLLLDAGGQPVRAGHPCLACLLPAFAGPAACHGPVRPVARAMPAVGVAPQVLHAADAPHPPARGPPVPV